MVRLQEEARLLRAEESALLAEVAERLERVEALTEELCDAQDAVEEVGAYARGFRLWGHDRRRRGPTGETILRLFRPQGEASKWIHSTEFPRIRSRLVYVLKIIHLVVGVGARVVAMITMIPSPITYALLLTEWVRLSMGDRSRPATSQVVSRPSLPPTNTVSPSSLSFHQMNGKLVDAADKHSDPTRLCTVRSAIRQLKADVKAMDVLIGANWAALAAKQLGRQEAGEIFFRVPP